MRCYCGQKIPWRWSWFTSEPKFWPGRWSMLRRRGWTAWRAAHHTVFWH